LIQIANGGIGANHGVAPAYAKVLQRAVLDGVADVHVALPFLAADSADTIETVTGDIAHERRQPRYPVAGEVDVVAGLPGFLVGTGEVEDLDVVDDVRVGLVEEGERVAAADLLVAEAEGVGADAGPEVDRGEVVVQV